MSSAPAVLLNRDHPALVRFRHAEKTVQHAHTADTVADREARENHEALVAAVRTAELGPTADSIEAALVFVKAGNEAGHRSLEALQDVWHAHDQWLAQHKRCTAAIEALYTRTLSAVAAALVAELEAHLALVAGLEHDDDPPPPLHRSPIRTCHATTGPPRHNRRCISTEFGPGRLVATQGRKRAT